MALSMCPHRAGTQVEPYSGFSSFCSAGVEDVLLCGYFGFAALHTNCVSPAPASRSFFFFFQKLFEYLCDIGHPVSSLVKNH